MNQESNSWTERDKNQPIELIAAGMMTTEPEAYAEANGIVSFGYDQAIELMNNPEKLVTATQKVIDWIRKFNRGVGMNPEISERVLMYLTTESSETDQQNVLLHEAQHLVKLPDHLLKKAKVTIFPFGSLSRAPVSFDDWDNIPLYISQIGGITSGFDLNELTPEQTIVVACAPKFPGRTDIMKAEESLLLVLVDSPARKILEELIAIKKTHTSKYF